MYLCQRVRSILTCHELPTIMMHVATSAGRAHSLEDVPPHEQRLVHDGQVLDSERTIACLQSFGTLTLVEES